MGEAILSALQNKILIKGGGHKMAGGFSIEVEKIEKFIENAKSYRDLNL